MRAPYLAVAAADAAIFQSTSMSVEEMWGAYLVMLDALGWSRDDYERKLLDMLESGWE